MKLEWGAGGTGSGPLGWGGSSGCPLRPVVTPRGGAGGPSDTRVRWKPRALRDTKWGRGWLISLRGQAKSRSPLSLPGQHRGRQQKRQVKAARLALVDGVEGCGFFLVFCWNRSLLSESSTLLGCPSPGPESGIPVFILLGYILPVPVAFLSCGFL